MTNFRQIQIVPDSEAAKAFAAEWRAAHPTATNVTIKMYKHCEGKEVRVDYDEETD